jgi:hypothetical protein
MRKLIAIFLVAFVAACGDSTSPPSTAISIVLRDDSGAPAGRNQIVVTQSDGTRITASTGTNGKANISVAEPGDYVVSVIQRNAFIGSDALTKHITVAANTTTVLEFTLYRGGTSTTDPPEYGNY